MVVGSVEESREGSLRSNVVLLVCRVACDLQCVVLKDCNGEEFDGERLDQLRLEDVADGNPVKETKKSAKSLSQQRRLSRMIQNILTQLRRRGEKREKENNNTSQYE